MEQQTALGPRRAPTCFVDARVNMAVGDKKILPAVVVVIDEAGAPSQKRNGYFGNAELIADIRETSISFVLVQRVVVVRENRVVCVQTAIVLVIAERDSHRCGFAPVLIEGV